MDKRDRAALFRDRLAQAMAVAGSMAGVPVLSSAVYGTANLFVTQSHLGALGLNRPAPAGVLD